MRVLNPEGNLLAQAGNPQRPAKIPPDWGERVETHESLGSIIDTAQGKVFLALLPFRLARPPHPPETKPEQSRSGAPSGGHRAPYFVELAIPLTAVAGAFDGLRQNLVVGLIAFIALMVALAIIALRGRHYVRGKYLESELHLARRVQRDL
jgi:cytochrome b561